MFSEKARRSEEPREAPIEAPAVFLDDNMSIAEQAEMLLKGEQHWKHVTCIVADKYSEVEGLKRGEEFPGEKVEFILPPNSRMLELSGDSSEVRSGGCSLEPVSFYGAVLIRLGDGGELVRGPYEHDALEPADHGQALKEYLTDRDDFLRIVHS